MESELGYYEAKALLEWQIELGADEAITDAPVNRYEVPQSLAQPAALAQKKSAKAPRVHAPKSESDLQKEAQSTAIAAAARANTLEELSEIVAGFEACELKKGARGFCFSDGDPQARIMVVGEVPSVDDDRKSTPFSGVQGQLLDKMFAAIGHLRSGPDPQTGLYLTSVLPWPTPQGREPTAHELALMRPFLIRHIELADPDVIVVMGNSACQSLLDKGNVNRLRGKWTTVQERPALPMFHPMKLLLSPESKREAWADLLALQARLKELDSHG